MSFVFCRKEGKKEGENLGIPGVFLLKKSNKKKKEEEMKRFIGVIIVVMAIVAVSNFAIVGTVQAVEYPNPVVKIIFTPLVTVAETLVGIVYWPAQAFCCGFFKGTDKIASRPEYVVEQIGLGLLNLATPWNNKNYTHDLKEDATLALIAEKYPIYNYGKWGAAAGGLTLALGGGPFIAGLSEVADLAAATAIGAASGAAVGAIRMTAR